MLLTIRGYGRFEYLIKGCAQHMRAGKLLALRALPLAGGALLSLLVTAQEKNHFQG